jgi:transposase
MEKVAVLEDSERRGAERSEAPRSGEASNTEREPVPDPQVATKATRRQFTSEFKLQVLREADQCGPGELGALLRRHGLYSSHLSVWRRERDLGAHDRLSKKRGRKPAERNPLSPRLAELKRENRRLQGKLKRAELIIDIQKNVRRTRGVPPAGPETPARLGWRRPGGVTASLMVMSRSRKKTWSGGGLRT